MVGALRRFVVSTFTQGNKDYRQPFAIENNRILRPKAQRRHSAAQPRGHQRKSFCRAFLEVEQISRAREVLNLPCRAMTRNARIGHFVSAGAANVHENRFYGVSFYVLWSLPSAQHGCPARLRSVWQLILAHLRKLTLARLRKLTGPVSGLKMRCIPG